MRFKPTATVTARRREAQHEPDLRPVRARGPGRLPRGPGRRTLPLPALHHSAAGGSVRAGLGYLADWPACARSASQLADHTWLGYPNHPHQADQAARPDREQDHHRSQAQAYPRSRRSNYANSEASGKSLPEHRTTVRRGADGDASGEGRRAACAVTWPASAAPLRLALRSAATRRLRHARRRQGGGWRPPRWRCPRGSGPRRPCPSAASGTGRTGSHTARRRCGCG